MKKNVEQRSYLKSVEHEQGSGSRREKGSQEQVTAVELRVPCSAEGQEVGWGERVRDGEA